MAFRLFLIGTNHERAPIGVRERLAVAKADLPQALGRLCALPAIQEAYILSTCNRTEVYAVGKSPRAANEVVSFLARLGGFALEELVPYTYRKDAEDAVVHLFSVAAGANSMVLGDAQILGQIKESFTVAAQGGALGKILHALLRKALEVGKLTRTQTGIGGKAASISYAAVEVTKKEIDIKRARALIVGAGKMGRLVAKILADSGAGNLLFANRTFAKAQALAEEFGGRAVHFHELASALEEIDVAIVATQAPDFIIHGEEVRRALQRRPRRPLLLVDLGTPRNIDDGVREIKGVSLYNIDDLRMVIQDNLEERRGELKKVEEIIAGKVEEFMAWYSSSSLGATIKALRELADTVRIEELHKMDGKLACLSPHERNVVDMLTSRIINRLLHLPITGLKATVASGDGAGLDDAAKRLFHLGKTP